MAGQVENEIKLRVPDPERARAAVRALGAAPRRPRHFEDNLVLDDARGSLRASGRLLRLRRAEGSARLTLKVPRGGAADVKVRHETELEVSDPDALQAILAALGFRTVFRYQKYREAWSLGDVEILVDETPIGTFLEIEGPVEAIRAAAAALGYAPGDFITDSYVGLFFAGGGRGDMVFG